MATRRYHTASWSNPDGSTTTVLLDAFDYPGDWPTAIADSPRQTHEQLRDLMQWRAKKEHWLPESDITDPKPTTIRVDVRPECELEDRTITFPDTVAMQVACVNATRDEDAMTCYIPTLQISFDYTTSDDLKQLVKQYVQQHLKGIDTRALGRLLRPDTLTMDTIAVRAELRERSRAAEWHLPALSAVAEPILRRGSGATAWSRDNEVGALVHALESERASVLVVGPPGIGKSAVINAAAAQVRRNEKLEGVTQRAAQRYWRTGAGRLIAGMKYLGQWEQRCEEMVDELARVDGVICIDDLLELVRVGGEPSQSVAAFFTPYIEHGDIRFVAEATEEQLDACRRLLPSLVSQLHIIRLEPWPRATCLDVLDRQAKLFSEQFNTPFDPLAPELVYRLFRRFLPHQEFPGRAFLLMREAFTFARTLEQSVDNDIVLDRFAALTGLPDILLRDDRPLEHQYLLDFFTARVIGQEPPCVLLADLVTTFKSAMNDTSRPIGVVLLCGPTGVGKTESAKALADFLFPHHPEKDRLIRLDMSEYASFGAVERLTTKPGGQPSDFLQRVRRQPFNVLLLDEIEKASPEVFDLLLGVLDEGRLVDTYGRVTDFRCCFILMTSNIAGDVSGPFGFSREKTIDAQSEVLGYFRPEFFNRLDAVMHYRTLDTASVRAITRLHLDSVAKRPGLRSKNVQIEFAPALVDYIAEHGFDERYGARPLQRLIEEFVVTPIAKQLAGEPDLRDAKIEAGLADGALNVQWRGEDAKS